MKMLVAVALLGAVVGFVAGSKWHTPADDPEAIRKVVEKSERRIEVHRPPSGGRSDRGTANEPPQLIQNARHAGIILDGVARARLIEEILELPAGAFPEVLNSLKQIKGENAHDPFSVRIPEFLAVGLARWYELEGASVLDWVLSQPDELEMDGPPIDSWGMVQTMILDGFARDPGRALELMQRYHALCQTAGSSSEIEVSSFYQLGRWSRDVEADLTQLQNLAGEAGLSGWDPDDPFASDPQPNSGSRHFIKGMLDAGRKSELRKMAQESHPELREEIDDIVKERRNRELQQQGWESLRAAIDRGEVKESGAASHVLYGWGESQPEEALTWFLDQKLEGLDRGDQIEKGTVIVYALDDPFTSNPKLENCVQILKELEYDGEPVRQAWVSLGNLTLQMEEWDDLEVIRDQAPSRIWTEISQQFKDHAAINLVKYESVWFGKVSEKERQLFQRFGVAEEVAAWVEEVNQKSRREFERLLGDSE